MAPSNQKKSRSSRGQSMLSHLEQAIRTVEAKVKAAKQPKTKRARRQPSGSTAVIQAPAVSESYVVRTKPGMGDIKGHDFTYQTVAIVSGYGADGNTTHIGGKAGSMYAFSGSTDSSGNLTIIANNTGYSTTNPSAVIPIAPADVNSYTNLGEQYIKDVLYHYRRIRFRRIKLIYEPYSYGSDTTSKATVWFAPLRGYQGNMSGIFQKVATADPVTLRTVQGCTGNCSFPSWKRMEFDMTPYIAGGSGSAQNEFDASINGSIDSNTTFQGAALPCSFLVGGDCPATSTGNVYGFFRVECLVDLLDFNDAVPNNSFIVGKSLLPTRVPLDPELKTDVRGVVVPPPPMKDPVKSDPKGKSDDFVSVSQPSSPDDWKKRPPRLASMTRDTGSSSKEKK